MLKRRGRVGGREEGGPACEHRGLEWHEGKGVESGVGEDQQVGYQPLQETGPGVEKGLTAHKHYCKEEENDCVAPFITAIASEISIEGKRSSANGESHTDAMTKG